MGPRLELLEPKVQHSTREPFSLDATDVDVLTDQLHREWLRLGLALECDAHLTTRRPAHPLDDLVDGDATQYAAIDRDDLITWAHPGAIRRRAANRRDDRELVVPEIHLDSNSPEGALGVFVEGGELLWVHVGRVGIELGYHAFDRTVEHATSLEGVDVGILDVHEHPSHLIERRIRARALPAGVARVRGNRPPHERCSAKEEGAGEATSPIHGE